MLKIDGVQLIGINNRSLGMVIIISCKCLQSFETLRIIVDIDVYWNFVIIETFKVDTSNTKTLLEKRGDLIRDKGILVRPPYSCVIIRFGISNYVILLLFF